MTGTACLVSDKLDILTLLQEQPEDAKYQGRPWTASISKTAQVTEKFKEAVIQSKAELLSAGFDEDIFRNLLSTFVSVIEQTEDQASSLLSNFNDPTTSDIIVHYLRLLVSSYLQNRAEFFQHFVEAPNLRDFCVQDVETMGLECDHVQILALSQALGINIQIECMEGADCSLNHHIIPDGSTPSLHLLYKTAHYDILYKGSVCRQSQEGAYR
ncbi:ubiquitin thioesterase OTUB2-like isoform X4 [Acipenser ruthenus]|uniref:ubiquitin thioesterase OTUB2-like isoform X4 n=1 Tax=Acipenser ruthenus TaxID=7906 RepID=UPI002740D500|nr:ubiquitin thioesterase OTUB2-like isoform X4 [Acipenser ruthenus]